MVVQNNGSSVTDWLVAPEKQHIEVSRPGKQEQELNVTVVFTTYEATGFALETASLLAARLNACITLLAFQVVPYPLPLTQPRVSLAFFEHRLSQLAGSTPVSTAVFVYLCRDPVQVLRGLLKPRSLVVLGGRKRWWRTPEKRLAGVLRKAGHEVILSQKEKH
jgi:hypothetical protein